MQHLRPTCDLVPDNHHETGLALRGGLAAVAPPAALLTRGAAPPVEPPQHLPEHAALLGRGRRALLLGCVRKWRKVIA